MSDKKTLSAILVLMGIALVMCLGICFSCSEHEDPYYGNTSVGNILLDNNSIVSTEAYDPSTMNAIGVIVGSRSDSVWIVSTKELGQYSYSDSLESAQDVSTDISELNGRENTAALLQSETRSQAAIAVQEFNAKSSVKGWFLPSLGELRMLAVNLSKVSSTMKVVGGDPFVTTQYLSSTQDGSNSQTEIMYAYCVTLQTNYVSSILKTETAQVRPILRLKIK